MTTGGDSMEENRVKPRDIEYYIRLSMSDDFQDRMIAEYQVLKVRYEKLNKMIRDWKHGRLNFTPKCPVDLLEKQSDIMWAYMQILRNRAAIEVIDLNKYE